MLWCQVLVNVLSYKGITFLCYIGASSTPVAPFTNMGNFNPSMDK